MATPYGELGGRDGLVRPEGWHMTPDGSRWAMYAVYYSSSGKLAHAAYFCGRVVGVVFSEHATMGPKQRRRFTRFSERERPSDTTPAEWFARSQPFTHPREVIAAAEAAGQPFKPPRVIAGPGILLDT